ncbi:4244_t:CDS:2 [Cetraspora pellucida]|uniref:4244_t:CDS:1 n=1 Tax=Cetraspora pellucida TaxID=1433469 RepID=A0ACA9KEC4_9GLOM|nr:4244_t:CDS:2 [Cetraspora pellucida]
MSSTMLPPPSTTYNNADELLQNALETILQNLQSKYQNWPEHQQAATREALNNMINAPVIVLQNPQIIHTRGRPSGSSNH